VKNFGYDAHMEEDGMSGTYKIREREENAYKTLVEKLEKKSHLRDYVCR
jgi:hypothetical protein